MHGAIPNVRTKWVFAPSLMSPRGRFFRGAERRLAPQLAAAVRDRSRRGDVELPDTLSTVGDDQRRPAGGACDRLISSRGKTREDRQGDKHRSFAPEPVDGRCG